MALPYRLTPRAANDIDRIWNYIALDNPNAASQVEEAIYSACSLLGTNPLMGSIRRRTTKLPIRFWPIPAYPNYTVVYLPEPSPIRVIAILHGKRNIRKLLKSMPI